MKAAHVAIILAQLPVILMIISNLGIKNKTKKGKLVTLLIVEFISVIIALLIAGWVTGNY